MVVVNICCKHKNADCFAKSNVDRLKKEVQHCVCCLQVDGFATQMNKREESKGASMCDCCWIDIESRETIYITGIVKLIVFKKMFT